MRKHLNNLKILMKNRNFHQKLTKLTINNLKPQNFNLTTQQNCQFLLFNTFFTILKVVKGIFYKPIKL